MPSELSPFSLHPIAFPAISHPSELLSSAVRRPTSVTMRLSSAEVPFLLVLVCLAATHIDAAEVEMSADGGQHPVQRGITDRNAPLALNSFPRITYGTAWKKDATSDLVYNAIVTGFRHVDTACQPKHYNEKACPYERIHTCTAGNESLHGYPIMPFISDLISGNELIFNCCAFSIVWLHRA